MRTSAISRRTVLQAAASAVVGAAAIPGVGGTQADATLSPQNEETIRKYYAAWEKRDWHPIDILLADDFTFTSANNDDHISKGTFKARCWESQIDFIKGFDLERVIGHGNEAFVMYVCRTKNGKSFRNVEYLRLRDYKVESIECYFGGPSSFPSAVSAAKR